VNCGISQRLTGKVEEVAIRPKGVSIGGKITRWCLPRPDDNRLGEKPGQVLSSLL
jgi:hypothetical protein